MFLSFNPWALVQKTRHMFLSSFSYSSVKQKVREKARLSFRLFDNEKSTNVFFFKHKSDYFLRKPCVMPSTAISFLSTKFQGPPLRICFLCYH